jgi:hypothetical protein
VRYDHEFAIRLMVAEAARRGEELVRPIGVAERGGCGWVEYCTSLVGSDDPVPRQRQPPLDAWEWLFGTATAATTPTPLSTPD